MFKRSKVIISEEEPGIELVVPEGGGEPVALGVAGVDVGFLWFKPSTRQFYQVTSTDPLTWGVVELSGNFGNVNFTGTVSADGNQGLTGAKTIAGYTFTFKKGLLVGFQAP